MLVLAPGRMGTRLVIVSTIVCIGFDAQLNRPAALPVFIAAGAPVSPTLFCLRASYVGARVDKYSGVVRTNQEW